MTNFEKIKNMGLTELSVFLQENFLDYKDVDSEAIDNLVQSIRNWLNEQEV
jgi:hypothetical protein